MLAYNNDDLIYTILTERNKRIRNGVYGLTQREMAYNSNKIEGSTLTKRHTETLFNEGAIYSSEDEVYKPKDIEEMQGHFAMFNYMLDTLTEPLSEELIKGLHKNLKQCVFEDIANGYNIGEYKGRKNFVGDISTSLPDEVPQKMKNLLEWFFEQQQTYEALAEFHLRYEKIHPFQDGNGRTGRIILFRQCLLNNLKPFIIQDKDRGKYLSALEKEDVGKLVELFKTSAQEYETITTDALMTAPEGWQHTSQQKVAHKKE